MTHLLFENLVLLLLVELVLVAVALGVHRRRMTPGSRRFLWGTLAVCVLLVAVQRLVVTDREKIEAMLTAIGGAVEDGDVPALGEHLAEDITVSDDLFAAADGRDTVLSAARQRLQDYDLSEVRLTDFRIEVEGDTAAVSFQAFCDVRGRGGTSGYKTPSRWRLTCVRRDGRWLVQRARGEIGLTAFGR